MKPQHWILVLLTGLLCSTAPAQFIQNRWHTQPFREHPTQDSSGIPVRQGTHLFWYRTLTADQQGNWYLVWFASPNGVHGLYASKIGHDGEIIWTRTVNDGPDRQEDPVIFADSTGLYIAWVDYRIGIYQNNPSLVGDDAGSVMAQKLDPNGNRLWNVAGATDSVNAVPVCMVNGYQNDLCILPDGVGGVYITWEDNRNNLGADLYGLRLNVSGQRVTGWNLNGNAIAAATGNQPTGGEYSVDIDGSGGLWVAWIDNRRNHPDIYYQHVYGNGTMRWMSEGRVFIADTCDLGRVKICSDGSGGAFFVWRNRSGLTIDLWMQRIDSSGTKMWSPDTGIVLESLPTEQTNPRIISSSTGNAIVSWEDYRNDPTGAYNEDLYAQKVTGTATLTKLWQTGGVPVCTESHNQLATRLSSDGLGGCIVVWEDLRTSVDYNRDVYAQRINSFGQAVWQTNGLPVSAASQNQSYIICQNSRDRLLFAWIDEREGSAPIYRTVWNLDGTSLLQFPTNGIETVPDINGNIQCNTIGTMGSTRIINTWVDQRRGVMGDRIYYSIHSSTPEDSNGTTIPGITKNGNPITLDSTNRIAQSGIYFYSNPQLISTPDSGTIVVYFNTDPHAGSYIQTLRAQKISYNGERMWGDFGSDVCGDLFGPDFLTGKPDGNGGAYLAYTVASEPPFYYNEVHFQHINSSGQRLLSPTGIAIEPGLDQGFVALTISDSNIYVGYIECFDLEYGILRVHIYRLLSDGTALWHRIIAEGDSTLYHNLATGYRSQLKLLSGADGSVIAYWMEFRYDIAGGACAQIMAQRLDPEGTAQWGDGIRLGASDNNEEYAVGMTTGSTYWFGWQDARIGGYPSIYLQHLDASGHFMLDSTGQRLRIADNAQTNLVMVNDNSDGAYLFFTQYYDVTNPFPPPTTNNDADVIGIHLAGNGTVVRPELWTPTATPMHAAFLEKARYSQFQPQAVAVPGGAVVNWRDMRATLKEEFHDLYMQRVCDDASVQGVREVATAMPKQFTLQQNYPNPFNSTTVIRFTLPRTERVKVAIYDIMGREVINLLNDVKTTGTYELRWNGKNSSGMKVSSGMYFYRMETSQGVIAKKMTLLN